MSAKLLHSAIYDVFFFSCFPLEILNRNVNWFIVVRGGWGCWVWLSWLAGAHAHNDALARARAACMRMAGGQSLMHCFMTQNSTMNYYLHM